MKLEIKNLHASIQDKKILNGVDLTLETGTVHALMGPNGSGKSTLSHVLLGDPAYEVEEGEVLLDGTNILECATDERARLGLFLAFQYPVEIPGITVGRFLKRASDIRYADQPEEQKQFVKKLRSSLDFMKTSQDFINRYLNEGFSGGEKKRMEIVQMLMLQPYFAILDETDSGLDIDALKIVSAGVNKMRSKDFSGLIITHYQRILDYLKPDYVHVMYQGRIVRSGDASLVQVLEAEGYEWLKEEAEVKA